MPVCKFCLDHFGDIDMTREHSEHCIKNKNAIPIAPEITEEPTEPETPEEPTTPTQAKKTTRGKNE